MPERINSMNSPRNRSTQKLSESVSATCAPAADEAAAGRRAVLGGMGVENHVFRANGATKRRAEFVVLHLADVCALHCERGDPDDGVGPGAPAHHRRVLSERIERLGAIFVDQRHRPFDHVLCDEEFVIGVGDDVDEGIAQPQNVQSFAH
jgi:hypothetical protein